ncbi:MAG: hypothetical protein L7G98_06930, partial [Vulcanisaeta sp.]|nr:hypothetical protein [Vulcanisaeta sp.]
MGSAMAMNIHKKG